MVRGYLLEIKHGLNRMANIVKNLLACSRNEFPIRQKVAIKEALEHALASRESEIIQKNITVDKKIDEKIPLLQDLGMEMIFTNLLRNSIDALPDGGKISVLALYRNDSLTIDFSDTGEGIPKEEVGKIFEPFYTTKDIDKGCGLGLTIVGEIVKSYDGKIEVKSKPEHGTTFTIKLPVE